jgi:hypothetical protein
VRRRQHTAATGWWLVAGGLVLVLVYALLVWSAVYGNDQTEQPCDGPHRDIVFPPATECGVGGNTVRITSTSTTVAASVILLIALGLLVVGVVGVVRARRRREPRVSGLPAAP